MTTLTRLVGPLAVAALAAGLVDRRIADRAGTDRIHARARHLASGQVCDATIAVG